MREKDLAHAFRSQLTVLLKDTHVDMVAEMGKTVQTIGQILELETDDIIKLNTGPQDPVTIKVQGIPKYLGMPGIIKGNRAVQVTDLIEKEQGA